jgi:hypothetical protein
MKSESVTRLCCFPVSESSRQNIGAGNKMAGKSSSLSPKYISRDIFFKMKYVKEINKIFFNFFGLVKNKNIFKIIEIQNKYVIKSFINFIKFEI